MRILSIVGTFLSFVIIVVLSFENIQASCNYLNFFFWELPASVTPTFIIFGTAMMGMVTGAFATLAIKGLLSKPEEDDEDF